MGADTVVKLNVAVVTIIAGLVATELVYTTGGRYDGTTEAEAEVDCLTGLLFDVATIELLLIDGILVSMERYGP